MQKVGDEKIMNSAGNLLIAIMWIFMSPVWFFLNNTVMGIIWLCGGIFELIVGLIRRSKEKKGERCRTIIITDSSNNIKE